MLDYAKSCKDCAKRYVCVYRADFETLRNNVRGVLECTELAPQVALTSRDRPLFDVSPACTEYTYDTYNCALELSDALRVMNRNQEAGNEK